LLLYGSETVFHAAYHIYCVTSRLLLSLEDILLRTLVTRNYCCRAREVTMSFMDTLIALTYLVLHVFVVQSSDDQRQRMSLGNSWSLWTKARLRRARRGMYRLGILMLNWCWISQHFGSWLACHLFARLCGGWPAWMLLVENCILAEIHIIYPDLISFTALILLHYIKSYLECPKSLGPLEHYTRLKE